MALDARTDPYLTDEQRAFVEHMRDSATQVLQLRDTSSDMGNWPGCWFYGLSDDKAETLIDEMIKVFRIRVNDYLNGDGLHIDELRFHPYNDSSLRADPLHVACDQDLDGR
jgi:hypothetical protein